MTVSCFATATCCAARPPPWLASIVSNMSAMSFLISGVTLSMRSPFLRRTGWPYLTISKIIKGDGGTGDDWCALVSIHAEYFQHALQFIVAEKRNFHRAFALGVFQIHFGAEPFAHFFFQPRDVGIYRDNRLGL